VKISGRNEHENIYMKCQDIAITKCLLSVIINLLTITKITGRIIKMKKKFSVLIAFLLVFVMVAACGDSGTPSTQTPGTTEPGTSEPGTTEPGTPAAPAGATTLTFWTFQQSHATFLELMAESWNRENPGREVVIESSVFGYDDNHNNLLISLQTGTGAPDMADIEISRFALFLAGEPQLYDFNAELAPIEQYVIMSRMENYAKDGKYYGIDYHVGIPVIYYNATILASAGIDYMDIVTWEDFIQAGLKLKEETGIPMATLEVTEHWSYYPLVTQRGSDWFDGSGNVTLDSPANVDVLNMLYDMMYEYEIAVAAPGGFHHAEEWYGFMNGGGAASVWMPQWFMNRFTDHMPDLKGDIVMRPLPLFGAGGSFGAGMGGTGTVVTNQAGEPQLAKDFLVFAKLSQEGAIRTWTDLGFDPLRWDVWGLDVMKEPNVFTDYFGTGVFDMLLEMRDGLTAIHLDERFPAATTLVQSQVVFRVLDARDMTAQEALTAAAAELRAH